MGAGSKQKKLDNLNTVRPEASRHFRNKRKGYLKAKIDELQTNSKIKNMRDSCRSNSDFKAGYQPRFNIVRCEKGGLVADCHSILVRWRNHFSQMFNVHGVSAVRQTEIHATEPPVPNPSAFQNEMDNDKIKRHREPGIDHPSRLD